MLSPSQVDTCTEELLRDSHACATERNLPWTIHAAQSGDRVPRDAPPPRHDADPVDGHASACSTTAAIIAHCHLPRPSPLAALDRRARPRPDGRERGRRSRTARPCSSRRGITLRTLGGYIAGRASTSASAPTPIPTTCWTRCGPRARRARHRREASPTTRISTSSTRRPGAAPRRSAPRRPGPDRGRRAGPTSSASTSTIRRCCRCTIRCAACWWSPPRRAISDVYVDGHRVVADGRVTTIDLAAGDDRARGGAGPDAEQRAGAGLGRADDRAPRPALLRGQGPAGLRLRPRAGSRA